MPKFRAEDLRTMCKSVFEAAGRLSAVCANKNICESEASLMCPAKPPMQIAFLP